jgi:hypothetical protein
VIAEEKEGERKWGRVGVRGDNVRGEVIRLIIALEVSDGAFVAEDRRRQAINFLF